ncbi:MAG TPA: peptide deformylase [Candidatus Paceibacterota bacterium]|jgi:peptide deformylase|nr:peptide deformylase [Candidatus Paceibacterota bacterium]
MAKDPIVQDGDPVLRQVAKAVPQKDLGSPAIFKVIKKLKQALAPEKYGVAIAAPQVGESLRIFVVAGRVFKPEGQESTPVDLESSQHEHPQTPAALDKVYINPEITRASRAKLDESEGCLSVRNMYGVVARHERVTLKFIDEEGNPQTQNASGLLGHIFQHEVDHLNGILFIDKAKDLHESK